MDPKTFITNSVENAQYLDRNNSLIIGEFYIEEVDKILSEAFDNDMYVEFIVSSTNGSLPEVSYVLTRYHPDRIRMFKDIKDFKLTLPEDTELSLLLTETIEEVVGVNICL